MKNARLVLMTAVIATVIASCNKQNDQIAKPGTQSTSSPSRSLSIRPDVSSVIVADSNGSNPFNYIGIQHDSGCSVLLAEINHSSPTLDADILNDTKEYLQSSSYDSTSFDSTYTYITGLGIYSIPDSIANNPTTLFTKMYNAGSITYDTYNYLNTMNTIINTSITSDTPTQAMYNRAASQIASIETEIGYDMTLPPLQKDALLMTGSVYRYSGAYWGTFILTNGPTLFGIKLHWKGFLAHDAAGAIAGAIGGGIATETLHGAFIGAIGGGIGTSIGFLFTGN